MSYFLALFSLPILSVEPAVWRTFTGNCEGNEGWTTRTENNEDINEDDGFRTRNNEDMNEENEVVYSLAESNDHRVLLALSTRSSKFINYSWWKTLSKSLFGQAL